MKYEELTESIIRSFYEVFNELGCGFLESVYEKALTISLRKQNLSFECQKDLRVYFQGEEIGFFKADIIVEDKILIEIKACQNINNAHIAQTINYLKATNIEVGLLVNFGKKIELKRLLLN